MTRSTLKIALGLLALCVAAPSAAQEEAEEVRGVIEAVAAGMQAADFTSLDTLFSDSRGLHIIEGAGVNHGWADYRDNHLAPELRAFENFSYRWFAIEPTVDGNAAWSPFRYELSADAGGRHVEIEGRGTIVLQRTDGQWKVVHMHTSGRPAG
jgi:ketosteroid isomerase-like protein